MLCICCLSKNRSYINLTNCIHGEYLARFPIPNLTPPIGQVVCHECHLMLKKIYQFKLQVEESFRMLKEKGATLQNQIKKKQHLKISKIKHFIISEQHLQDKSVNARSKNIKTALKIINTNSTTLRSLPIVDTIVSLTKEHLLKLPALNKDSVAIDKNISENVASITDMVQECIINGVATDKNNVDVKLELPNVLEEKASYHRSEMLPANNSDKTTVEVNKEVHNSVLPVDKDGAEINMLPATTNNFEGNVLSENNKTNDKQIKRKYPLTNIKLNKTELLAERKRKLKSKEYLKWMYRCRYCVVSFQYEINLNDHVKRKHEMQEGQLKCKICKQIVHKKDKTKHKFLHFHRIECNECKKRFILFDEARRHYRRVHGIPLK